MSKLAPRRVIPKATSRLYQQNLPSDLFATLSSDTGKVPQTDISKDYASTPTKHRLISEKNFQSSQKLVHTPLVEFFRRKKRA